MLPVEYEYRNPHSPASSRSRNPLSICAPVTEQECNRISRGVGGSSLGGTWISTPPGGRGGSGYMAAYHNNRFLADDERHLRCSSPRIVGTQFKELT